MYIGCERTVLAFPAGFFPTEGFVVQVHPLHVRALVLGRENPFILVSIEMTSLPDDVVSSLRQAAAMAGQTPCERVWITVTHTFSAPHILPDHQTKTDRERKNKETLCALLLAAVSRSVAGAAKRKVDMALTIRRRQSAVVASRDIALPEGWWVGWGGKGLADKTLTVIEACAAGETRALLLHLNVQPSVLDGTGAENGKCVSSDLAGVACAALEKAHPGAVVLFLIGAAGDMAPIEKARGITADGKGGFTEIDLRQQGIRIAERLGAVLASEAAELLAQPGEALAGDVAITEAAVIVPAKKMNRDLHALKPTRTCIWESDGDNRQPLFLMTLGQLAILGVKPELTYATDQTIKAGSPFPYTLVATLVNGGAKYMASRDAYDRCMYEAINSPFGPGAAERLAHSALTMMEGVSK